MCHTMFQVLCWPLRCVVRSPLMACPPPCAHVPPAPVPHVPPHLQELYGLATMLAGDVPHLPLAPMWTLAAGSSVLELITRCR